MIYASWSEAKMCCWEFVTWVSDGSLQSYDVIKSVMNHRTLKSPITATHFCHRSRWNIRLGLSITVVEKKIQTDFRVKIIWKSVLQYDPSRDQNRSRGYNRNKFRPNQKPSSAEIKARLKAKYGDAYDPHFYAKQKYGENYDPDYLKKQLGDKYDPNRS